MIPRRLALLVLSALMLSACASLTVHPRATTVDGIPAEREILVMLPLPPPHFRPDAVYGARYAAAVGRDPVQRTAEQLAHEHGLTIRDTWPMPALGLDCVVMIVGADGSANEIAARLARDPRVEWAQRMHRFHVLGTADPLYPFQSAARRWPLAELRRVASGRGVLVAEIDSGVDVRHPDLTGQVESVRNFVDAGPYVAERHGTAVAGIIVARAENGVGIAGIAPQARLLALRACWQKKDGQGAAACTSFTLAKALQFAIERGPAVINLSLAGPRDRLLERLLDVALMRNIAVVGAVDPQAPGPTFPSFHPGVLAVAVDGQSSDTAPDGVLRAPGRRVLTTLPGGRWGFVAGSSFAAAQVTGMVALLRQLRPGMDPAQLRAALAGRDDAPGAARESAAVDPCAALARVTRTSVCAADTSVAGPTALPLP